MRIKSVIIFTVMLAVTRLHAGDWEGISVPADPGSGFKWVLQAQSDDFNYDHPVTNGSSRLFNKWTNCYHNSWSGPGLTIWDRDHVFASDGTLRIPATRYVQGRENKIRTGCITSTSRVRYPVYIEARARVMNSTLASDVWLLSPDDSQEIDILEAYGSSYSEKTESDQSWYAHRIHMSHHVFIRNPYTDWQPSEYNNPPQSPTWITRTRNGKNVLWRQDYHRYGVYWKDPWHIYYYIDGELVARKEGRDEIDPLYHTNRVNPGDTANDTRTGLNKAMDIIINVEDQDWRSNSGLTPADSELANSEDHTFKVDWIRIYKPERKPKKPKVIAGRTDGAEVAMTESN